MIIYLCDYLFIDYLFMRFKKNAKEAKLKASCYNLFLILIVVLCRC